MSQPDNGKGIAPDRADTCKEIGHGQVVAGTCSWCGATVGQSETKAWPPQGIETKSSQ